MYSRQREVVIVAISGTMTCMNAFVILLRGINVGGKNKVSMAELKSQLLELGFKDVVTYINSGNVLATSDISSQRAAQLIEEMLPKKFALDSASVKVLVLTKQELQAIVKQAPKGFGSEPAMYYCDAIFLMGVKTEDVLPLFSPREGVDRIWPGVGVVYSQRLAAERTKSRLSKVISTPEYKSMTIRSWGTTTKLLAMLQNQQP